MGCGSSVQSRDVEQDVSPQEARRPGGLMIPATGEEKLHMVVDVNGDKAYVSIFDRPWNDLSTFNAARKLAELSDEAAAAGAMRSAMKSPDHARTPLEKQKRVLKLSLQPEVAGTSTDTRVVRCKLAPT